MASLNALDAVGNAPPLLIERLKQLPKIGPVPDPRYAECVSRLLSDL
jgi:hypothetical protein